MTENIIKLTVPEEYHLERIDKFLTKAIEMDFSRSYVQKLIKGGHIVINDNPVKQNYKSKTDDEIIISVPEPEQLDLIPQDIPVNILYEDDFIAVINKQPGLVVHPGPGNWDKTLVNALLFHLNNLSSIGGVERPGIVHRLDKDTSGLMVIAKNDVAHRNLVEQFSSRQVEKYYTTVVQGKPKNESGIIEQPIARHRKYRHKMTVAEEGKEAVTEYFVKKIWNFSGSVFSMLKIRLHTGRTHQIRVHMSSMGNSVVGDPIYSKKWAKHRVPYLLLASTYLSFTHPGSGEKMKFEIPIPQHIEDFIERLEKRNEMF